MANPSRMTRAPRRLGCDKQEDGAQVQDFDRVRAGDVFA
jgi:hypothetical protein